MPAADPLPLLLAGRYLDEETGETLSVASRSVVIEDTLDGREADLVASLDLGPRLSLLADPDTFTALGARVERALASRFSVQRIVLDARPRCDTETLAKLLAAVSPGTDAIVAVGSGTLNDLAKLVALRRGVPQLVFATAPSMNGYTSVSASIVEQGLKRSVRAATPVGVFVDLGVLAAAPPELVRAGLGDSVCRSTAQADWLLAHLLRGTPYRRTPYDLLRDDEPRLVDEARGLVAGDLGVLRCLARTLILSGFGMTVAGGSQPASQGEHLVSHFLEMTTPGPHALHGAQVGVASLELSRLQEAVLARSSPPVLRPSTVTRADVEARFGAELGERCWRELEPKLLDVPRAEAATARLAEVWDGLRSRIAAVHLGGARLRRALLDAGAATEPAEVGWTRASLTTALAHAREVRDRYTFLDLVADAG